MNQNTPLCSLKGFSLEFVDKKNRVPAVTDVDMEIHTGEMVALIGESGSGKSLTALSLIGLQPENCTPSGSLCFEGREMLGLPQKAWEKYRGNCISMIFQEPMTALNPLIKVGAQIMEILLLHRKLGREAGKAAVLDMLKQVGLADAQRIYGCYPHQLSGGQRQRIMIAMAFINKPTLLIADEPTTALDVTVQTQIMRLMHDMGTQYGTAVLLISHDLGVVREVCSRAYIMYAGRIMESGPVAALLEAPHHPYTIGLVEAIPSIAKRGQRLHTIPGTVPPLHLQRQEGCPFYGRCFSGEAVCATQVPHYHMWGENRVFCHFTPLQIRQKHRQCSQREGKEDAE